MGITIKTIRGIAVTNLVVLGLASCSSTPAPWTQEDSSPWGAKHEAAAQDAASDEAISDTSLNDPVLLADSEPEAIVMEEPELAPAPEVIVPVVVEDEPVATQDIMQMLSTNYAVQVFAGTTVESVENFKANKDVADLMIVKTDRSGSIIYVLVDIYPDRATADAAAADLEIKTGSKPWVRSLGGLQEIVAP
jgi:septal ring-binding cell division protein DamX